MAIKTGPFVCVMPFTCTAEDGSPITFAEGARLEASDEMVRRFPDYWVSEDNPSEMANRKRKLMAEALSTPPSPDTSAAQILNTKYRAKRAIRVDVDGEARQVKKGDLVEPNDPIAALVPDRFELVQV
jgi:hypothetical protein